LLSGVSRRTVLFIFLILSIPVSKRVVYWRMYTFLDMTSFLFVGLTLFLFIIYFVSMLEEVKYLYLCLTLLILGTSVRMCFIGKKMMIFFLLFELSLIPTAFLIFSFGVNPERLRAVSYFILYTAVGSFPLMLNLIKYGQRWGSNFFSRDLYLGKEGLGNLDRLPLILFFWGFAFLIKSPMYGVHLWLPKAHVEAPTVGSMVLAAILLKLGIYGLIRFNVFFEVSDFLWVLVRWIGVTLIYSRLVRFRSKDIKIFIAYSSIAHMGVVLLGFWKLSMLRFLGVLLIRIGHGFRRSGLFSSVKFFYRSVGSRNLLKTPSAINISPLFVFMLFLLCCSKASVPPFLSLFGEIEIFSKLMSFFPLRSSFILGYVFLVGLYNMYLYLNISHGFSLITLSGIGNVNLRLKLNLLPQILAGLLLFFASCVYY
jgi:NADH-ubiquinone oxidoreductase chain 4